MGKIISIVNQKGGVGKTTTAVNLASAVGIAGKKVLLIDLDPQGNTTSAYGIAKNTKNTSYSLLMGEIPAGEAVIKTAFKNVDVIPTTMDLAGAEIELISVSSRENALKNALSSIRDNYDFIFIDCPPSLSIITINALTASDSFLVPIQCEYFALEGLSQLMASVRQVKLRYNSLIELEGVLLTMYDGRLNLTQQVVNEVQNLQHTGTGNADNIGNIRQQRILGPGFQFPVDRLVAGIEEVEHFLIFAEGGRCPGQELVNLLRQTVPQGQNAFIQLGCDHNDQRIDDENAGYQA